MLNLLSHNDLFPEEEKRQRERAMKYSDLIVDLEEKGRINRVISDVLFDRRTRTCLECVNYFLSRLQDVVIDELSMHE